MILETKDLNSSSGGFGFLEGNGFCDFSGLNAACAHFDAAYGSIGRACFDALQIREETPAGNPGDLFTNTACLFCKTTAGNGPADKRFSIADSTVIHRAVLYPGLQGWQAVFSDIYLPPHYFSLF